MSGGVDSSVAAALLARSGRRVTGVFMRSGVEAGTERRKSCCSADDAYDARRVADALGIPFYALNLASEFGELIEHVVDEYARGRTPNPCVLCNRRLKFGRLFDFAAAVGADAVATGHYARLEHGALRRALDPTKDQSYVLFDLPRERLDRIEFPLGRLTKSEVRRVARDLGLGVSDKPESMDVCFVPDGDLGAFLARRLPLRPGPVVTADGTVVGTHAGAARYTIGQRRGLGVALGRPAYVTRVRARTNTVVVGDAEALMARTFRVRRLNWLIDPPYPSRALVQIRAHQEPRAAVIDADRVRFEAPVRAITPGQAAVFYDGDRLLGGGWID
jgi:tRNA-specific 2-thiouridylase